jgi:hypothetical protein
VEFFGGNFPQRFLVEMYWLKTSAENYGGIIWPNFLAVWNFWRKFSVVYLGKNL